MEILNVTDERFRKYGKVIEGYDFTELVKAMDKSPLPEGVIYEPSIDYLEELPIYKELSENFYGEMPIEIGFCNGHNKKLNAVEYHRDSELNIAATDAVLIVGLVSDIEPDGTYDTAKMEAFRVPKGVGVEVYATTLHYAPANEGEDGFKVVIVLPRGTNYPLKCEHNKNHEDKTIAAVNKWLIGHPEGGNPEGTFLGLKGINPSI